MKRSNVVNSKNYKAGTAMRGASTIQWLLNTRALSPQDWDVLGAGCRAWDLEPRLWGTSTHEMAMEALLLGAGFGIGRNPWFTLWNEVPAGESLPESDQELSDALLRVHDAATRRRAAII